LGHASVIYLQWLIDLWLCGAFLSCRRSEYIKIRLQNRHLRSGICSIKTLFLPPASISNTSISLHRSFQAIDCVDFLSASSVAKSSPLRPFPTAGASPDPDRRRERRTTALIFESSPEERQTPAVMASAYFNWTTVEEIRPALLQNSLGTVSNTKATNHLRSASGRAI
jgi:hypothetical protein